MPSLAVIREDVAQILRDELEGWNVHAELVDTVTAPAIELLPVSGKNVAFNRGVVELDLELRVTTRGEAGQSQLDDVISAAEDSIPAVLHARPTAAQNPTEDVAVAGVSYTISDQGFDSYTSTSPNNVKQWQAVYHVKVLAKGTT